MFNEFENIDYQEKCLRDDATFIDHDGTTVNLIESIKNSPLTKTAIELLSDNWKWFQDLRKILDKIEDRHWWAVYDSMVQAGLIDGRIISGRRKSGNHYCKFQYKLKQ